MRRALVASFMAVAFLSFSSITQAQSSKAAGSKAGSVKAGEQVFLHNCFQCHSTAEGQVRFGPSLYHEAKKPHPKKTDAQIREILENGKNGKMPSFKGVLTREDTDNLLAYIHSL